MTKTVEQHLPIVDAPPLVPSAETRTTTKPPYHLIRLDRSKTFSTVHGDRLHDDPLYSVSYFQDALPFDAQGKLVMDDGKTASWEALNVDGKRVMHHPLYDEDLRNKLKRKLERLTAARKPRAETAVVEADEDDEVATDEADLVNLEAWLRGETEYEPFVIFRAVRARHKRNFNRLRDVIDFLTYEINVVHPKDVHSRWMALLDKVA